MATKTTHVMGKRSSVLLSLLLLCLGVNSFLTWIVGSKLGSLESSTTLDLPTGRKRLKRQRRTMAPQESSQSTAGFVHIGKTGGSTISKLLRNGCTSFVAGPCRNITNESLVSKWVVSSHCIHTLDFFRNDFTMFILLVDTISISRLRSTTITFQTFIDCPLPVMDRSSFQFGMFMNALCLLSSTIIPKMLSSTMSS